MKSPPHTLLDEELNLIYEAKTSMIMAGKRAWCPSAQLTLALLCLMKQRSRIIFMSFVFYTPIPIYLSTRCQTHTNSFFQRTHILRKHTHIHTHTHTYTRSAWSPLCTRHRPASWEEDESERMNASRVLLKRLESIPMNDFLPAWQTRGFGACTLHCIDFE